jgi:hypothetical protein
MSVLKKPKTASKSKRKFHPLFKWFRNAGFASELLGWGGLLLGGWFLTGVTLIYLGFLVLGIDLWLEPTLRSKLVWRAFGLFLVALFAGAFTLGMVFVKAPLEVSAFMTDADYPTGTKIANIEWRREFTEVDVWITNPSEKTYDDLLILIRPTVPIAAISQLTNVPSVSFEDKNGLTLHLMDVNLDSGIKTGIPLELLATDAGYRVRCARLPGGTTLKIVLALAEIKWNPGRPHPNIPIEEQLRDPNYILRTKYDDFSSYWQGHRDGDVYASRPTSMDWLKAEGTYTAALRTRSTSQKISVGGNLTIRHWR